MFFLDFLSNMFSGSSTEEVNKYFAAAEQGDVEAQYQLGSMYSRGKSVKKNYELAVKWYTAAAEQGFAPALNNLGFAYQSGRGVSVDEKKAAELYSKGAEQGYPMAQYNLGFCYENGIGVEVDEKKAEELYRKAVAQGNSYAQEKVEILDILAAPEKLKKEKAIRDKEQYGFSRDELVVESEGVSKEGNGNSKYMDQMVAIMSQKGYDLAKEISRERSIRQMKLDPVKVEQWNMQDEKLKKDASLHADIEHGMYFQQCGDVYINPKFVTTIGVHMIKTSDIFAVSYDLVRSRNSMKVRYLLVFYTYNKLLQCFATEIVVGIGTKQYDYFVVEGTEKFLPYLNLKYPIKSCMAVRYHLKRDEQFINLFKYPELEDDVFPDIESQRGMFDPSLYACKTSFHKEAIGAHFKRGYKPEKTILLASDDE